MERSEKWSPQSLIIPVFALVVVAGLALSAHRLLEAEQELRRTTAIENAARYSEALRAFREVYTSEVVQRASDLGIPATHDYLENTNAIPLPATMTRVLGERLGKADGVRVGLYSAYPFPWRPAPSELDSFQRSAIEDLSRDPDSTVVSFQQGAAGPVVRYAVADRLEPECVDCHNTHPSSPKKDWKIGDVRGVLEVSHPVSAATTILQQDLRKTVFVLVGVGITALAILALAAVRQRHVAANSQRMVREAVAARARIQEEMMARIAAEDGRIAAEAQVQYAQKLESLGVMAGGIAHDFNNLLVSILGNTQLAQAKMGSDTPAFRHLTMVEQAGVKAADLTTTLLQYAGKSPAAALPMDLNSCIDEMVPLLTAATGGRTGLTLELEQSLPLIVADQTRVEQVLLNLITNAAEASETSGNPIIVRTGTSEPESAPLEEAALGDHLEGQVHIFLEIEDSGSGLDTEARARMFDPFFSTKGTGRGLGLSAILGIVKAHNGSVLVKSQVGEGTVFRVGFPSVVSVREKTTETQDEGRSG